MPRWCSLILYCLLLAYTASAVAEEPEGAEKPKKPPPKPSSDSAISAVLHLKEVQAWKQWMESQGYTLEIWGENIETVGGKDGQEIYHDATLPLPAVAESAEHAVEEGHTCWNIAVAENDQNKTHVWARFCAEQFGNDIWVQGTNAEGYTIYYPYEKWKKLCEPMYNSPGTCKTAAQ